MNPQLNQSTKEISRMNFLSGQKVKWLGHPKVYDFGYYSQVDGKAVIYEEGECNMQDSYAVDIADLSPANKLDVLEIPQQIRRLMRASLQSNLDNLREMLISGKVSNNTTVSSLLEILSREIGELS